MNAAVMPAQFDNPWDSSSLVMNYAYEVDLPVNGGGGVVIPFSFAQTAFQINADSDFYWLSTMYAADGYPAGGLDIIIENAQNNRRYMSDYVPLNSIAGNSHSFSDLKLWPPIADTVSGTRARVITKDFGWHFGPQWPHPFMLPQAEKWEARQSFIVTLRNSDAAGYNVTITFLGLRVFP